MNSNLFKKTNNNGWLLCPSKRFPGKFYYFNAATGETEWCLNDPERRDLKSPPLQKLDSAHSYPEPNSPPVEEIIPSTSRQKVKFIPFHENTQKTFIPDKLYQKTFSLENTYQQTFNSDNSYNRTYSSDNVHKTLVPENAYIKVFPSNQIVNYQNRNLGTNVSTMLLHPWLPYQIPVPMTWPDYGNPQMAMILMNQTPMNRQLAIEEPRPPPVEIQSPERDVPVHSSNTPLSQRFVNFTDPVYEYEPEFNVNDDENPISTKYTTNKPYTSNFVHNQSLRTSGPSKYSQNVRRNPIIHEPVFSFKEQKRTHGQINDFLKRNPGSDRSNLNKCAPSTSRARFGAKTWQNPIKNTSKFVGNSNQNNFFQYDTQQSDQNSFGQNQKVTKSGFFGHAPSNQQQNYEKNQIPKESVRLNLSNQNLLQSQHNQNHIGQSHIGPSHHINQTIFDQRQVNQRLQNHTNLDTSQIRQIDQNTLEPSQSHQKYFNPRPNEKIFVQSHVAYKNQNHLNQTVSEDTRYKELFRQNEKIFRTTQQSQNLLQNHADQDVFGQSHRNKPPLRQSPNGQENFSRVSEPNQNEQNIEEKLKKTQKPLINKINQEIFRKQSYNEGAGSQNEQNILELSQKNKVIFRQSPINKDGYGKITNDQNSHQRKSYIDNLKSADENDNVNSTVIESPKVEFQKNSSMSSTNIFAETNSTIMQGNKVDTTQEAELDNLDENDLRRTLLAKKRKCVETAGPVDFGKKLKTSKQENTKTEVPKKKVTFNLIPETYSDCSIEGIFSNSENNAYNDTEQVETMSEDLPPSKSKMWYVVTDTNTLMQHYEDLDKFVQTDTKCSLVIPHRVLSDVKSLSRGESSDRRSVIMSRQLLRSLQTNKPHVIVQPPYEESSINVTTSDSILKCCLEIMENADLILVTDDNDLHTEAETFQIECCNFDQLHNSQQNQNKVNFDIEKIKISIGNNVENYELPTNELENLTFDNIESNIQNKKKEEQQIASIFKQANEKIKNKSIFDIEINQTVSKQGSIFEIDGIKKLKPQTESKSSIFKNIFKTVEVTKSDSIFKSSCGKKLSQESNFGKENNENNVGLRQSIFDTEAKNHDINEPKSCHVQNSENQTKTSISNTTNDNQPKLNIDKELNNIEIKSDLKEFLYNFCVKNKYIENIEEKKVEILCSFKQILEESLTTVLKNYSSYLLRQHDIVPPYSVTEVLQGAAAVHADITISGLAGVLMSVFDAKEVSAEDVIKSLGCGIVLVKCLKMRAVNSEHLNEAEKALEFIIEQAHAPYFDIKLFKTTPTASDLDNDRRNRRNFVRDRSYVIDYLKKHFPAWADYVETTSKDKSKTSTDKKFKDAVIVRTCGKNLGNLTLNNSKPMTMNEPENIQNGDNPNKSQNQQKNHENYLKKYDCINNNKKIIEKSELKNTLSKNLEDNSVFSKETSSRSVNEKYANIKLVRSIKNNTIKSQNNNMHDENIIAVSNIEENEEMETKLTEPKIVRIFDNINSNKGEKNNSDIALFDDYTTHGHTFGTNDQNGPKVLINIKPIKEFEDKFNNNQRSTNLDRINSFENSTSNYVDDSTNLMSDSNSTRLVIDENALQNNFDGTNDVLKQGNDIGNGINDFSDATNDTTATNNKSYSMSLDNCVTNNIYGTINIDDILQTDDMITSTNDMKNPNPMDNFIEMNHDFKLLNFGGSENFDVKNDKTDDMIIDSGYENIGKQAYYLVDTFLYELKIVFKLVAKFIAEGESELRSGAMVESQRQILHNSSVTTHKLLCDILEKLRRIIYREFFRGARVKDLVKGAGLILAEDERIQEYRHVVGNCYQHAKMLNIAVKMMIDLTRIDS